VAKARILVVEDEKIISIYLQQPLKRLGYDVSVKNILTHLDIPIIYLTAYTDKDTIEHTQVTSPSGYVYKPFEERDLDEKIRNALETHKKKKVKTKY
jgi:FixJ family two-component response regulator